MFVKQHTTHNTHKTTHNTHHNSTCAATSNGGLLGIANRASFSFLVSASIEWPHATCECAKCSEWAHTMCENNSIGIGINVAASV